MNKKILLVSILSFLMLLTISFASAINTNNTDIERKESPLYRIRAKNAITNRINEMIKDIKVKFLRNRLFCLPFHEFLDENGGITLASIITPTCITLPCTYQCTITKPYCVC